MYTHMQECTHSFSKAKSTVRELYICLKSGLISLPNQPFWPPSKCSISWPGPHLSLSFSLFSLLVKTPLWFFFNNPSPNTATARFVSRCRFSSLVSSAAVLISITASTLALRNDQTENERGWERSGFWARIAFFFRSAFFPQISKYVKWQRPSADLPERCLWLESCSLPLALWKKEKRLEGGRRGVQRGGRLGTMLRLVFWISKGLVHPHSCPFVPSPLYFLYLSLFDFFPLPPNGSRLVIK